MKQLRCLVVDDEPLARKVLREYIEDVDFLALAGEAGDPVQANNFIVAGDADLLFLDVQMPKMSGVDFLRRLRPVQPVILTTAHPQYALEGFELDVLDYLLKPVGFERFLRAANKARDYCSLKERAAAGELPRDYFFVKCGQTLEKINVADILLVEAMANYVIIHTTRRRHVTYLTFKLIEDKLPASEFVRIHKSYLVALKAVQSISDDEVELGLQKRLPMSKHYKAEVMRRISPVIFRR